MPKQFTSRDERHMGQALAEARKGLGRTRPNPAVGAVVVKGAKVVAVGHHRKAGGPHAEADALRSAGAAAKGATLYVTLEPCCHTGRTGPCTEAVIQAGIARVVIGCTDANPVVNGHGVRRLKRAGIAVDSGCLEQECLELNRAFFCWISEKRPLVTLKFATTLDGVIGEALAPGAPAAVGWITGPQARAHAHKLRALHHAIVVGRGTLVADDPLLTVRTPRLPPGGHRDILRVVLDSTLQTSANIRLLNEPAEGPRPLFVAAPPTASTVRKFESRRRALEAAGAEVMLIAGDSFSGRPSVPELLKALADRRVQSVLVEGGPTVWSAFVNSGFVDQVAAFVAPRLAGGGVSVAGRDGRGLQAALALKQIRTTWLGQDLLVTGRIDRALL